MLSTHSHQVYEVQEKGGVGVIIVNNAPGLIAAGYSGNRLQGPTIGVVTAHQVRELNCDSCH